MKGYFQVRADAEYRRASSTVHNIRDPDVPVAHEEAYAELVAQAGCSDYLFQRNIDAFGHSDFITSDQHIQAFNDLVVWVKDGVEPAP